MEEHSYYLTIVTHRRNPILIDNIDLLRESFRESKRYYQYHIAFANTPLNMKIYQILMV